MRQALFRIALFAAAFPVMAGTAEAFGTIHLLGQNAEHERITRHALACGVSGGLAADICFQPRALDEVAGKSGTFGAVGAPDNPLRGLVDKNYAHCDNGDFMTTPGYPQSAATAEANLKSCRNWMASTMKAAVDDSAALLKDGKIDAAQVSLVIACTYNGAKGRAKCNAFEDFGLALHAAQDFYSHSNWTDQAAAAPISTSNVPGLRNTSPAPWLDLRRTKPFPPGLMTGCFVQKDLFDFSGTGGCQGRATHQALNKDEGQIDPVIGAGTTPRGKVDSNFRHAVEAAIAETRDKWAFFREQLIARYGQRDGALMICALTHDNPTKDCR